MTRRYPCFSICCAPRPCAWAAPVASPWPVRSDLRATSARATRSSPSSPTREHATNRSYTTRPSCARTTFPLRRGSLVDRSPLARVAQPGRDPVDRDVDAAPGAVVDFAFAIAAHQFDLQVVQRVDIREAMAYGALQGRVGRQALLF